MRPIERWYDYADRGLHQCLRYEFELGMSRKGLIAGGAYDLDRCAGPDFALTLVYSRLAKKARAGSVTAHHGQYLHLG